MQLEAGQVLRVFYKDQLGGPGVFSYLDVQGAQSFEVGAYALVVRKEAEDCYYPLMQLAAFKVLEQGVSSDT
ncbi:MAG: hypothetical protein IPM52_14495 [Bacteroidetes bacterium]|nr:hypothetical protein [Bacteroidota bacterium]